MIKQLLIGLAGKKGSGKSTAARHLRERYGFAGTNLTDPMDEMLTPLLRRMGVPEEEILPRLAGEMKNEPIPGYEWLSGRRLKQALGREFRDAVSRHVEGVSDRRFFHDLWKAENAHHPRLIHEQVRYPHERELIGQDGGHVYKIFDPDEKGGDDHESERIDFDTDGDIPNPKTGVEGLHARLDALMADLIDEEPSPVVLHAQDESPVRTFEDSIDQALNEHGDEIRAVADHADVDETLSALVDRIGSEISAHLAKSAADAAGDDAAIAAEAASAWVAENVTQSTSDRRVAAVYAHLGLEGARARLGVE